MASSMAVSAAPVPKKNKPAGKNAGAAAAYSMAGWAPTAAVLAAAREPGLTVAMTPAGAASASSSYGSAGTAGRTMQEVQAVFGKNAVEFYALYQTALKEDPALQGRVVVSMTIEPTGKVSRVGLVSSELGDDELVLSVLRKVEGLNFGRKAAPVFTVTDYPITFVPR